MGGFDRNFFGISVTAQIFIFFCWWGKFLSKGWRPGKFPAALSVGRTYVCFLRVVWFGLSVTWWVPGAGGEGGPEVTVTAKFFFLKSNFFLFRL